MLTDMLALCAIAGFCAKVVDELTNPPDYDDALKALERVIKI